MAMEMTPNHPFPNEPERNAYDRGFADSVRRSRACTVHALDILLTRLTRLRKDLR